MTTNIELLNAKSIGIFFLQNMPMNKLTFQINDE